VFSLSAFIERSERQAREMKTLSLLALMSSPGYVWHIKITQIQGSNEPRKLIHNARYFHHHFSLILKACSLVTPESELGREKKKGLGGESVSEPHGPRPNLNSPFAERKKELK
jgi:hypothetical protein